jgi:hypothetical protein
VLFGWRPTLPARQNRPDEGRKQRKFGGDLSGRGDLGGVSVHGEAAMAARLREEGSPPPVYGKAQLELIRGKVDLV